MSNERITLEFSRDEARLIADELLKESDRRRAFRQNRIAERRAAELDGLALRIMDAVEAHDLKPQGVSDAVWNLAQQCLPPGALASLAHDLKKGDIA